MNTAALCLAAILFALNIADALLTDAVLARGGREKNPVMAWLMAQPLTAPYRWAIKLGIAVGLAWLIWALSDGWWRVAFMGTAGVPFYWVCLQNWAALERLRAKGR